jgi:putative ABC transport system ATP-binding protein
MALLSAERISKSFDGTAVLSSLSFSLDAGEHMIIMGPSGSGKSTLLNLVARLIEPDEGQLTFRGEAYGDMMKAASFRLQHIGFMFQDFYLLESLSVFQNIDMIQRARRGTGDPLPIDDVLAPLGLSHRRNSPVQVLSRGERQRVALARAFANQPDLLLADEPTASLDPSNRGKTLDHLFNLCSKFQTTALVVSHDAALRDRPEFKHILNLEDH